MKILSRLCSVLFGVVAVLAITGTPPPATVHARQATGAKTSERPMLSALATADEPTRLRANEAYGKLPLSFEANQGQTDTQVKFLSRGAGYNLFLTSTEAVLSLEQSRGTGGARERGDRRPASVPNDVLRMKMLGANPTPRVEGSDQLPGKSNYFIGNNPKSWRVNVSTFARVHYREVYPGVDVVYYGNQRKLETDFIVAPGTNPGVIALAFDGANKVSIDKEGRLVLGLARGASGEVRLQKPVIYQLVHGARREVAGNYILKNRRNVGFEVGNYDQTQPLVIDPVLVYSTYLGGNGVDEGYAIAVDDSGNAYVTGRTASTNFPGAIPPQHGFDDVFVAKFNTAGSALIYSTYLGGSGNDFGFDIAVDVIGDAYVTGKTTSANFPVMNAFKSTYSGGTDEDAFVTRLNATGSALVYSTYLAGQFGARGWGIAASNSQGYAYVTGTTSINFPVTSSAFESTNFNSGFLTKLCTGCSGASSLVYSTFLAHTGFAEGRAIAADVAGKVYVTGSVNSTTTNFSTPGAAQTSFGGGSADAFVEKFNTNLSGAASRVYATYLGGSGKDTGGSEGAGSSGRAIAIDESGNAYITGATLSTNFPLANASQGVNRGQNDAFLTKLNATGSALIYSTYLGGSGDDFGRSVAVNVAGSAYVTGVAGPNFPTLSPLPTPLAGSGFVTKFTPSGTALVYSTILSGVTYGSFGIALDGGGNAFATGSTNGSIMTAFPFQPINGGGGTDGWVSVIADPTIIGRVLDGAGNPISNATVNLSGVPSATTTTDANGYFTFGLLTAGNNYTVSVSVANYIFNSEIVNNLQKNVRLGDFVPSLVIVNATSVTARTGQPFRFQVITTGGSAAERLSTSGLPAGLKADPVSGVISGTPTSDGTFNVILTVTEGSAIASATLQITTTSDPGLPVIISPFTANVARGQSFTYKINAPASTSADDITKFSIIGTLPLGLQFDPVTGTISGTLTVVKSERTGGSGVKALSGGALLGSIQLFASNSHGTATAPLTLFTLPPPMALNISTRLAVGTNENVLIGGFIMTGNAPKLAILRAIGPSLAGSGVQGALADPVLELRNGGGNLIVMNDNWRSDQEADIIATTIPPANDRESAIVAVLQPGAYTAIVRGSGSTTGVGLVEAYDLGTASMDVSSSAQLANISTRGFVSTGNDVMIGGFIAANGSARFVVRAIGPSLTSSGIQGALQDPTLELHDGSGATIATNDNWKVGDAGGSQQAEIEATTIPPKDDRESALVRTLAPGNYTAIVRGKNNMTGIGLVEVYNLQ